MLRLATLTISICLMAGGPAITASFSDPDWPCIQRKVETISVGQMWPHPIRKTALIDEHKALAEALVSRLSLRRISLQEAEAHVAASVQAASLKPDVDFMGQIFTGVFQRLNRRRTRLMRGIERYARKQAVLAEKIDGIRSEIKRIEQQDEPDFDRIDALEEKQDWDQRIFEERAKSLSYVCETPVLLEKRAYAIGQILLRHVAQ